MDKYEHIVLGRTAQIGINNGRPGSTAACLQVDKEMVWLAPFIHRLQPATILEIGIYKGGWQYVLCPWFAKGAQIIGVDSFQRHTQGGDDGEAAMERMMHRLIADGFMVDVVRGRSDDPDVYAGVKTLLNDEPLDLLHIDGAHSYEGASFDWNIYAPLVREGGLVVLHDIGTRTSQMDVKRLWEELKDEGRYAMHEIYIQNGIGVVEM